MLHHSNELQSASFWPSYQDPHLLKSWKMKETLNLFPVFCYFSRLWFSSDARGIAPNLNLCNTRICNKGQAPVHSSSYRGLLCAIARAEVLKRAGDLLTPEAQAIDLCQACASVAHEYHKAFKMWQLDWFTCSNSYLNAFLILLYFAPAVWSQGELY